MDSLIIEGPSKLSGIVDVSGSKNSALPLLFASILFDEKVTYENIPRLWDIESTLSLLRIMGCATEWAKELGRVSIFPTITKKEAPYELVKKMRAGILALGPLVAKYGEAKVSLPGGCAIGARPVNYHIEALRKMGVTVEVEEGYIHATVKNKLVGAEIFFPEVTVTGTENLLYVAVMAEGTTLLQNAACEPEVVALGEFLKSCGAKISGLGTQTVTIQGSKLKSPVKPIAIPPDRIEAGTWISISLATRCPLELNHCDSSQMTSVLSAFRQMGAKIEELNQGTILKITPADKYLPLHIETAPYPGFPTDMQAQILTLLCLAEGRSTVVESIFENRFMHVAELQRLGAKIEVNGNIASIEGPVKFQGAPIMATDLRASACLVLAGLISKGTTRVSRIYHLDRGYQRLDEKLRRLGAKITRVAE
ncbi:MAG: UDP-N-acetylglucosamine 1-carboxyvinyltransferase [Deltaproteobacteria bacterium]|nr:UDP-N-acetylglucosamine 1-carboxyvinyltransferase [Deltaproteobacteria bacterium]